MTVWLVCPQCTTAYENEATADRMAKVMNTVRACGGAEHLVIVAASARDAHESYVAAFAPPPSQPRPPERRDIDG